MPDVYGSASVPRSAQVPEFRSCSLVFFRVPLLCLGLLSRWQKIRRPEHKYQQIIRDRFEFLFVLVRMGPWSPQTPPTAGSGASRGPPGPTKTKNSSRSWVILGCLWSGLRLLLGTRTSLQCDFLVIGRKPFLSDPLCLGHATDADGLISSYSDICTKYQP